MTISIRGHEHVIRPITLDELESVLEVYRLCEDFLALGPVPVASMDMLIKDIEISKNECGVYCGIFTKTGQMIGILDYVPDNYQGDPTTAYLSLLMIAAPFRNKGMGKAIVEAFEKEVRKNRLVKTILAGVQVNNPQAVRFWQRQGFRIVSGPKLIDQTLAYDLRKDLE